jgi:hypothetical protein
MGFEEKMAYICLGMENLTITINTPRINHLRDFPILSKKQKIPRLSLKSRPFKDSLTPIRMPRNPI